VPGLARRGSGGGRGRAGRSRAARRHAGAVQRFPREGPQKMPPLGKPMLQLSPKALTPLRRLPRRWATDTPNA